MDDWWKVLSVNLLGPALARGAAGQGGKRGGSHRQHRESLGRRRPTMKQCRTFAWLLEISTLCVDGSSTPTTTSTTSSPAAPSFGRWMLEPCASAHSEHTTRSKGDTFEESGRGSWWSWGHGGAARGIAGHGMMA